MKRRESAIVVGLARCAGFALVICAALAAHFASGCNMGPGDGPFDAGVPGQSDADSPDGAADDVLDPAGVDPPLNEEALKVAAQPVFCCNPLAMTFSAKLSENAGLGSSASYTWDFGDGRTRRGADIEYVFPWAGVYTVTVNAKLGDGRVLTHDVTVQVGEPSGPPPTDDTVDPLPPPPPSDAPQGTLFAEAGPDQDVEPGATVTLSGTGTKSSGPRQIRVEWKQVKGPPVTLSHPTSYVTTFKAPTLLEGSMELRFQLVLSESSMSVADEVVVRVSVRPKPTVIANAGANQVVGSGFAVQLDGSGSRGSGTKPLTYQWKQTSGPAVSIVGGTKAFASFIAPVTETAVVTLTFELTVTQGTLTAKDDVTVSVEPEKGEAAPTEQQILGWYSGLPPLPKVHYSWPNSGTVIRDVGDDVIREYIRLTNAMTVWGEWSDEAQVRRFMGLIREVNATGPAIEASLGIVFRPWSRVFPPTAPPTYKGPEHSGELDYLSDRLELIRGWVEAANAGQSLPVRVSAVIFECERFFVRAETDADAVAWNDAILEKHDSAYQRAMEVFPDARIEWYGRGLGELFTLRELGDAYSIALYRTPERIVQRTLFRRTNDMAVANGIAEVTPWLALGASYRDLPDGTKIFDPTNTYDLSFSWQIGAEINDPWYGDRPTQFAPWHAAKIAIFWPAPWDPSIPGWHKHFAAYVRGAHNITELPR